MYFCGVNIGGYTSQANLTDKHLKSFIKEKDIIGIKKMGFNIIRFPVDYFLFESNDKPYVYDEKRMQYVDNIISLARKHKLAVILDLHKAPGHSFAFKERETNDIWKKKADNRKRFLKIWEFFAARYRKEPHIIYEPLNEPVAPRDELWIGLAKDAVKAIRKHDKKHWIVIESNLWGQIATFKKMKRFSDKKIIYSFHFYDPLLITHQLAEWCSFYKFNLYRRNVDYPGRPEDVAGLKEELEKKDNSFASFFVEQDKYWDKSELEKLILNTVRFKEKYKVPVLCGEFGCIAKATPATRKNWTRDVIEIFKKYGISYTYWNYKNMDFGIYDFSDKYKNSPNYANKERLDYNVLQALQNGIL